MLGFFVAALGGLVLLVTLAVAFLALPGAALTAVVLAALVVLVVLFVGSRWAYVVRLGDAGYRVRFIRGAGVRQAGWTDVEDVVATTVAGERCVVLRLRDGRTTTLPVRVLSGNSEEFVADLQTHLNTGHGYRRIG